MSLTATSITQYNQLITFNKLIERCCKLLLFHSIAEIRYLIEYVSAQLEEA